MGIFRRKHEQPQSPEHQPQPQPSEPPPMVREAIDAIFGPYGPPALIAITKDDQPGRTVWMAFGTWEDCAAFAARLSAPGCPAQAVDWDTTMPEVLQTVTEKLRDSGRKEMLLGVSDYDEWTKWELPVEPPPVPQLGNAKFGQSDSSPDSDGFNEGDRVMLAKPFWGESDPDTGTLLKDWGGPDRGDPPTYPAGSKGTIIYPDPASREIIEQMKASGGYIVAMDDGRELYAGGPLPGVEGAVLEKIPGQYQVIRQNGKLYVRPKFSDGDRVRLTQSFTSEKSGKHYEADWEGVICPLTVTMAQSWTTGSYQVSLDDDPSGADRGMIKVPAEVLELISR